MIRSFAPPDTCRHAVYGARPPVGEEGAAYAVVRRYLWPEEAPPAPAAGEGDPAARPDPPAAALPPGTRP